MTAHRHAGVVAYPGELEECRCGALRQIRMDGSPDGDWVAAPKVDLQAALRAARRGGRPRLRDGVRQVGMRLDAETVGLLDRVAEEEGVSRVEALRRLVRVGYVAIVGPVSRRELRVGDVVRADLAPGERARGGSGLTERYTLLGLGLGRMREVYHPSELSPGVGPDDMCYVARIIGIDEEVKS